MNKNDKNFSVGKIGGKMKWLLSIALISFLAGCGSRVTIRQPLKLVNPDIAQFKLNKYEILDLDAPKDYTETILKYLTKFLNKEKRLCSDNTNCYEVDLKLKNYMMRDAAERFFFGMMAGKDYLLTDVAVKEIGKETIAGSCQIGTYNASSWGSAKSIAKEHAKAIADYLLRHKVSN